MICNAFLNFFRNILSNIAALIIGSIFNLIQKIYDVKLVYSKLNVSLFTVTTPMCKLIKDNYFCRIYYPFYIDECQLKNLKFKFLGKKTVNIEHVSVISHIEYTNDTLKFLEHLIVAHKHSNKSLSINVNVERAKLIMNVENNRFVDSFEVITGSILLNSKKDKLTIENLTITAVKGQERFTVLSKFSFEYNLNDIMKCIDGYHAVMNKNVVDGLHILYYTYLCYQNRKLYSRYRGSNYFFSGDYKNDWDFVNASAYRSYLTKNYKFNINNALDFLNNRVMFRDFYTRKINQSRFFRSVLSTKEDYDVERLEGTMDAEIIYNIGIYSISYIICDSTSLMMQLFTDKRPFSLEFPKSKYLNIDLVRNLVFLKVSISGLKLNIFNDISMKIEDIKINDGYGKEVMIFKYKASTYKQFNIVYKYNSRELLINGDVSINLSNQILVECENFLDLVNNIDHNLDASKRFLCSFRTQKFKVTLPYNNVYGLTLKISQISYTPNCMTLSNIVSYIHNSSQGVKYPKILTINTIIMENGYTQTDKAFEMKLCSCCLDFSCININISPFECHILISVVHEYKKFLSKIYGSSLIGDIVHGCAYSFNFGGLLLQLSSGAVNLLSKNPFAILSVDKFTAVSNWLHFFQIIINTKAKFELLTLFENYSDNIVEQFDISILYQREANGPHIFNMKSDRIVLNITHELLMKLRSYRDQIREGIVNFTDMNSRPSAEIENRTGSTIIIGKSHQTKLLPSKSCSITTFNPKITINVTFKYNNESISFIPESFVYGSGALSKQCIVNISNDCGTTKIVLSSPIVLFNRSPVSVDLYSINGTWIDSIPSSSEYTLPQEFLSDYEFYFVEKANVDDKFFFALDSFSNESRYDKVNRSKDFVILTEIKNSIGYIYIYYKHEFINELPVPLTISVCEDRSLRNIVFSKTILSGQSCFLRGQIHRVILFNISDYSYSEMYDLEHFSHASISLQSKSKSINISMTKSRDGNRYRYHIYSPYIIYNKLVDYDIVARGSNGRFDVTKLDNFDGIFYPCEDVKFKIDRVTNYSNVIKCSDASMKIEVFLPYPDQNCCFPVKVLIEKAPFPHIHTNIITISPSVTVVNNFKGKILSLKMDSWYFSVLPGSSSCINKTNPDWDFIFSLEDSDYVYSCSNIKLNRSVKTVFMAKKSPKLRGQEVKAQILEPIFVTLEIFENNIGLVVEFTPSVISNSPIVISNESYNTVKVYQISEDYSITCRPGEALVIGLEQPFGSQEIVMMIDDLSMKINLNGEANYLFNTIGVYVRLSISNNGAKSLMVTNEANYLSSTVFEFSLNVKELFVSLLDDRKRELCLTTFEGIDALMKPSNDGREYEIKAGIQNVQIDDQYPDSVYGVVFFKKDVREPLISIYASLKRDAMVFLSFSHLDIVCSEVFLRIDLSFLDDLFAFFSNGEATGIIEPVKQLPNKSFSTIYSFDLLKISKIRMNLSHKKTSRMTRLCPQRKTGPMDFSDCCLELPGFEISKLDASLEHLTYMLSQHYKKSFPAYKIIGSADILFNPVSTFLSIKDFALFFFTEIDITNPKDAINSSVTQVTKMASSFISICKTAIEAATPVDSNIRKVLRREKLTRVSSASGYAFAKRCPLPVVMNQVLPFDESVGKFQSLFQEFLLDNHSNLMHDYRDQYLKYYVKIDDQKVLAIFDDYIAILPTEPMVNISNSSVFKIDSNLIVTSDFIKHNNSHLLNFRMRSDHNSHFIFSYIRSKQILYELFEMKT